MWGLQSLQKAAAIGFSRMDEIANQSLASATQLLEKLDGEFDDDEADNADAGNESNNEVGNEEEIKDGRVITIAPHDSVALTKANQRQMDINLIDKKSSSIQSRDPLDDIDIQDDEDFANPTNNVALDQDSVIVSSEYNILQTTGNNNIEVDTVTSISSHQPQLIAPSPVADDRTTSNKFVDSQHIHRSTAIAVDVALEDLQIKLTQALEILQTRDKEIEQLRETNKMIKEKGKKAIQARNDANAALQNHIKSSLEKEQQRNENEEKQTKSQAEEELSKLLLLSQIKDLNIKLEQQEQEFKVQLMKERKERSNSIKQELPVLENLQLQLQSLMNDKMILDDARAKLEEENIEYQKQVTELTATVACLRVELSDANNSHKELLRLREQEVAVILQEQHQQHEADILSLNQHHAEVTDSLNRENDQVSTAAALEVIGKLKLENAELLEKQDRLQQVHQLQQKLESVRALQKEVKEDVRSQMVAFTQDFLATSHTLLETVNMSKGSNASGTDSHSLTLKSAASESSSVGVLGENTHDKSSVVTTVAAVNSHEVPTASEEWEFSRLEANYNKLLEELQYLKQSEQLDNEAMASLETRLEAKQQELVTLQSDYDVAITQLKASAEAAATSLQQYQQAEEEKQLRINQLEQLLQSVTHSLEIKQEELTQLSSQYDTAEDKLRQYQEASTLSMELSKRQVLETQSEIDSLKQLLQSAMTEKIELNQQYRQQQAQVELDKDENAKRIETLEQSLSERIVENASIRQEMKSCVEEINNMHVNLQLIENEKSNLSSQLNNLNQKQEIKLDEATNEVNVLLDEIQFLKTAVADQSEQLSVANQKLIEVTLLWEREKKNAVEILNMKENLLTISQRATEAEAALSKVEDKKKRDLESLKKQNELIAQLQREKRQMEESAKEYNQDFIHETEMLKHTIQELQSVVESKVNQAKAAKQQEIDQLHHQIELLRNQIEDMTASLNQYKMNNMSLSANVVTAMQEDKDRIRSLSPNTSASDDTSSSSLPSTAASSSFVMIENENSQHQHQELMRKLAVAHAEIDLLTQRAINAEEALVVFHKDKLLETNDWKSKLQTAEALIKELQQERLRLERETRELEKAVSDSNYNMFTSSLMLSSSSGTAVDHRQRQRNDKDVESGSSAVDDGNGSSIDNGDDSSSSIATGSEGWKKNEAGLLPIIIQLWSCLRTRCPGLLLYIGERPPRLGLVGQVAVIYVVLIHIVMSYEISKRCPVAVG